ncbi:MAG: hypothetical protein WKF59_09115 [Chitinophagaceae bacterium]
MPKKSKINFIADEHIQKSAEEMLKELLKWTASLQQLRNKK